MKKTHAIYAPILGLLMLLLGSASALAVPVTIDFEGFSGASGLNGAVEDGFVLTDSGFVPGLVTPAGEASTTQGYGPSSASSDPLLDIFRVDGGLFELVSLESFFTQDPAVDTIVTGFLNGVIVGEDIFMPILFNTGTGPTLSAIAAAQVPFNLAGVVIDFLSIDIGIGGFEGPQAIDNIVLNSVTAVPVPSTLLLLGLALVGFARVRRTS